MSSFSLLVFSPGVTCSVLFWPNLFTDQSKNTLITASHEIWASGIVSPRLSPIHTLT